MLETNGITKLVCERDSAYSCMDAPSANFTFVIWRSGRALMLEKNGFGAEH
jgi:hypothetical protein